MKDKLDRLLALAALVVAAPLLAAIAIWVRCDSPGPAVFGQVRCGLGGRPFRMYKFRTMRASADPFGDSPNTGGDERITRCGRLLRRASLDELPQLFNVLRGEMSLVGPRPLYVQHIADWNARQRCRLLMKPGLTGLSQVHGRASLTIEEKLEWDVRYVQAASLRMDLWIIWRTIGAIASGAGLFETRFSKTRQRWSGGGGE